MRQQLPKLFGRLPKAGFIVVPVEEFREKFANPYVAAQRGFVDEVIEPRQTRRKLIQGLALLAFVVLFIGSRRDGLPPELDGFSL